MSIYPLALASELLVMSLACIAGCTHEHCHAHVKESGCAC